MSRDLNDPRQNQRLEQLRSGQDAGDDEALAAVMRTEDGRRVLSRLARDFGWMGETWDATSARQTDFNAGRAERGAQADGLGREGRAGRFPDRHRRGHPARCRGGRRLRAAATLRRTRTMAEDTENTTTIPRRRRLRMTTQTSTAKGAETTAAETEAKGTETKAEETKTARRRPAGYRGRDRGSSDPSTTPR